jgi:hypothetical protein
MTPLTSLFFSYEPSAICVMSSDFVMGFGISIHPDSVYAQYLENRVGNHHGGDVHRFVSAASR